MKPHANAPAVADGPATFGEGLEDEGLSLFSIAAPMVRRWRWLVVVPIAVALAAFGISYLVPPTYTALTTFLVPTPSQSPSMAALATLSNLSSVTGGATGVRSPGEQYAALLQSRWIAEHLIDRFGLMQVYEVEYRFEARNALERRTRITAGRRDALITVEFDDHSPKRAAAIANAYVEELRQLSGRLALTEAQQRRAFYQHELDRTREQLSKAQQSLQASGFTEGSLRAEPRAAAEAYARIRTDVSAAEIRLATLRKSLSDTAVEVRQQQAIVEGLRSELARAERALAPQREQADYLDKYREFRYQEGMFEFLTRQQESARLDESREAALVQVVDVASVPEWKSKPKRLLVGLIAWAAATAILALGFVMRDAWVRSAASPDGLIGRLRASRSVS